MRDQLIFRFICLVLFAVLTFGTGFQKLYAQGAKKNRVRLNVTYVKIMDGEIYFDVKASSRIDKKNTVVSNIKLSIFNIVDDEKITVGETTTNFQLISGAKVIDGIIEGGINDGEPLFIGVNE